jgi:hypothetical protein
MYNDWLDNHPGNALFNQLVQDLQDPYESNPDFLREACIEYIAGVVAESGGRFLHQSTHGTWLLMADPDIKEHSRLELHLASRPILRQLIRTVTFILSDYKYGIYRNTTMAKKVSIPYLREIKGELMLGSGYTTSKTELGAGSFEKPLSRSLPRTFKIPALSTYSAREPRTTTNIKSGEPAEPFPCAWCKSGDIVEGRYFEDRRSNWFVGTISHVSATGRYHIKFFDGGEDDFRLLDLRPFVPYKENEVVDTLHEDQFVPATILGQGDDGLYDVFLHITGEPEYVVHLKAFRRSY